MPRISTNLQISVSLASITVSMLFLARLIGLLPAQEVMEAHALARLVHSIALQTSLVAQRHDLELVKQQLKAAVEVVPDLTGCRWETPQSTFVVGAYLNGRVPSMELPISVGHQERGALKLQFHGDRTSESWLGSIITPFAKLIVFVTLVQIMFGWLYLRRVLNYLDPSRVLPDRVRGTLDALAEGLIVVDNEERIILANRAFSETSGRSFHELLGTRPSQLNWSGNRAADAEHWPWRDSLESGKTCVGNVLRLENGEGVTRTFRVNSVPLLDDRGTCSGAMTSFDDVTDLEERTVALTKMLGKLKASRDQIRRQNRQLHLLATRDPLTSALNRRSFFEQFEKIWEQSHALGQDLSCMILDVDHFKKVNDTYGHARGDLVLKSVVNVLHSCVRNADVVCRYGGEEFCILLPNTHPDAAATNAERFRHEIAATSFEGLRVTASFGLSSNLFGADTTQKIMDQADQALYAAKRSGRNRVMRWDQMREVDQGQPILASPTSATECDTESPISFQIVTALTSALAYRDAATAEHSRRVADLCVLASRDLLPLSKCYVLENAALLHDIGKIGVPDSILLKPGALAAKEWSVMRAHDEIGVEIIRSTFACEELTRIVMYHHAYYGGKPDCPEMPSGEAIPLGARILTIADAFDAMVTTRVYRKGFSQEKAFAELRKCAPRQFDPSLVEHFIQVVGERRKPCVIDMSLLSRTAAMRLGVQIENLSRAVDNRDMDELRVLSSSVHETALEFGIPEVKLLSQELMDSIQATSLDVDEMQVISLTLDLMELCRQTQRAHLVTHAQPVYPRFVGMEPTLIEQEVLSARE